MMLAPTFPRNALETANRLWFVARETNLPYTVVAAAREAEEWREEKEKLEGEIYDWEEKAGQFEDRMLKAERENEQLQDRIELLESQLEAALAPRIE